MEKLLTTGQAARLCSVTPDAVLKWIKSGQLAATRTPGGHYRIHPQELEAIRAPASFRGFKYCWEYQSPKDGLAEPCESCLVYRARARRCYEMAGLTPDAGHAKQFCDLTCEDCEYFRLTKGEAANILVVSDQGNLTATLRRQAATAAFNLAFAECEYSVSALVQSFRPDFVVIDCAMGSDKAHDIALHLLEDPRAPLVRVILAAGPGEYPDRCDPRIFARMERPFGLEEIKRCIDGIPSSTVGASNHG